MVLDRKIAFIDLRDGSIEITLLFLDLRGKFLNGEEVRERFEKKRFIWDRKRAERWPFDALMVFGENAYHCDLCGGTPQCVKVCTPKALHIS